MITITTHPIEETMTPLQRFGCLTPFTGAHDSWTLPRAVAMAVDGLADDDLFRYGWAYSELWHANELRLHLASLLHPSNQPMTRFQRQSLIMQWESITTLNAQALLGQAETERVMADLDGFSVNEARQLLEHEVEWMSL